MAADLIAAPFLEVITRCYKRPVMLAANEKSLDDQTSDDWIQTLIVDDIGRGVAAANAALAEYSSRLVGRWIWNLDDDDVCIRPTLIAELADIVDRYDPLVIMLRMDHGPRGILPPDHLWTCYPVKGSIGASAFVVRRDVWRRFGQYWDAYRAGDFEFIHRVIGWADPTRVFWYDVIASRVQMIGSGRPERIVDAIT